MSNLCWMSFNIRHGVKKNYRKNRINIIKLYDWNKNINSFARLIKSY